jgi:hypothetical protein
MYTDAQKKWLLEKHRDINVGHDWSQPTIEDFIEVARAFGITTSTDQVAFSGFWSQGDGASFTFYSSSLEEVYAAGSKTLADKDYGEPESFTGYVKAFYDLYLGAISSLEPLLLTHPNGRRAAEGYFFRASRISHHYSHSNTVAVEVEIKADVLDLFDDDPVVYAALPTQTDLDTLVKACADALYRTLESEHEYQTSDETVLEACEDNGIEAELDEDDEDDYRAAA